MVPIALLIPLYCLLALGGFLLVNLSLLRRSRFLASLETPFLCLLAFGMIPVVVAWLGFLGFFRIPGIAWIVGAALCCYAVKNWRRVYASINAAIRFEPATAWMIIAIAACTLWAKWCYFFGGFNNPDDIRSIALTIGFAANYLKPAFPYDFSIPISYNYYLYLVSAFLYASVEGYGWPSAILPLISTVSVVLFYSVFLCCIRKLFPGYHRSTLMVSLLCITFYGLDIFVSPNAELYKHIEWWNLHQITQMASYHHWVYQYLLGVAYMFAGFYTLSLYIAERQTAYVYVSFVFMALCFGFGAISAVWAGVLVMTVLALTHSWHFRQWLPLVKCLPGIVCAAVIILLPQIFNFIGRESLVAFLEPRLLFTQEVIRGATALAWRHNIEILWYELGPIQFTGCCVAPFYLWYSWQREAWFHFFFALMVPLAFTLGSILHSPSQDWYFRGSNAMIFFGSTMAAIWLFEQLRAVAPRFVLYFIVALALMPGMLNYGAETRLRLNSCVPPSGFAAFVNQHIPFRTVVIPSPTLNTVELMQGGRSYFKSYENDYSYSYRNTDAFLKQWFGYDREHSFCTPSTFGNSLPAGHAVSVSAESGTVSNMTCSGLLP